MYLFYIDEFSEVFYRINSIDIQLKEGVYIVFKNWKAFYKSAISRGPSKSTFYINSFS